MAVAGTPAEASAARIARASAAALGSGPWRASSNRDAPRRRPRARPPRARNAGADSSTTAAAPSPQTKPPAARSKGRHACAGSVASDAAPSTEKPSSSVPEKFVLAPSTTQRSTRPERNQWNAWKRAALPLADAAPTVEPGPRIPSSSLQQPTWLLSEYEIAYFGFTAPSAATFLTFSAI